MREEKESHVPGHGLCEICNLLQGKSIKYAYDSGVFQERGVRCGYFNGLDNYVLAWAGVSKSFIN